MDFLDKPNPIKIVFHTVAISLGLYAFSQLPEDEYSVQNSAPEQKQSAPMPSTPPQFQPLPR